MCMRSALALVAVLVLSGCGNGDAVSPPGSDAALTSVTMAAAPPTLDEIPQLTTTSVSTTIAPTTTTAAMVPTPVGHPVVGYVIVGGDWAPAEDGRRGNLLMALGPDRATWLGDLPASIRWIEGDLAGGVVYQTTDDWSIYRIRAGGSTPEMVVDLSGGDVLWANFEVVERLGSPAVLYQADTVLSGGVMTCPEGGDYEGDGDCGVFIGEVNRVAQLQPFDGSDAIDVIDAVVTLGLESSDSFSVVDYAAGLFEIARMDQHWCQLIEFWDEDGSRSESIPPSGLYDGKCDGVAGMTEGADLSRDGRLMVRHETSPAGGGTDLVVRVVSDGAEVHRLPVSRDQEDAGVHSVGYYFDGVDTIAVLYTDGLPLPQAGSFELVLTRVTPQGNATAAHYDVPAEAQTRLNAVDGGCCLVTFLQDLDVNLTD